MFIDFVTLMLINTAAGLTILACFVYWGLSDQDQERWAPAFAAPGFVSLIAGLHMIFNWPLPGPYNSAFGEMSVLFGALFLGTALALWKGWNKIPLAIYGFFAGLFAIAAGIRFIDLGLTMKPALTGVAFICAGLGGVFALPTLYLRTNKNVRLIGAIVLMIAAGILALTGYMGLWMHMQGFEKWMPATMQK